MSSLFSLSGKTILVTGASSGIGKQICITLAEQGAQLIITGRNNERLQETLQLLQGENHQAIACDLEQNEEIVNLVSRLVVLNGVVLCAGIIEYVPAKYITQKKIDNVFNINYSAQIVIVQQLLKNKFIANGASILFISSISSKLGVPGTLLYASSKAAVNSATKVLAVELAKQKIRVNSLCPGLVQTKMLDSAKGVSDESNFAELEKSYPLGIGQPEDVANVACFFMTDASRWTTGINMTIDGGHTLV